MPYCAERGIGVPHVSTVRRFLRSAVPPVVETVARQGRRAYQEQHEVRVRRDPEEVGVNNWWSSDHRILDHLVMVPDGKGLGWPSSARRLLCTCGSGQERRHCCSVRRVWATVTMDRASAAVVSWRLSLQPNRATVAHSLRQAIMRFGLPKVWVRDNGKEFTANLIGGSPVRYAGPQRAPALLPGDVERSTLWGQLGVRIVTTIPYSSWSKIIESFFSAFSRRYDAFLPGYVGRDTKRRPEKLKKEISAGRLLTAEGFGTAIERQVAEWNGLHQVGKRSQPPLAYYKEYRGFAPAPETLAFLCQEQGRRVVTGGALEIGGHRYVSDALALLSRQTVTVRTDPGDPSAIYVYPARGACLAVPECPDAINGEFGEANLIAKRASRAQRDFVREWALAIKGACPPERMDPYGAHRMVEARLGRVQAAAREQARAVEAGQKRKQLQAAAASTIEDAGAAYDDALQAEIAALEAISRETDHGRQTGVEAC